MRCIHHHALFLTAGVCLACASSPAAPPSGPSLAGTWHVAAAALNHGTLSSDTFDIVVARRTSGYAVTMPALTWSVGPVVYNSGARIAPTLDTTFIIIEEFPATVTLPCQFVTVAGRESPTADTLRAATVSVFNSDTLPGNACSPQAVASATVTK